MDFFVVMMLSLSILVSCSTARSTVELVDDALDSLEGEESKAAVETVTAFKLRVKDGKSDQYYDGEIVINVEKQTETMHFDAHQESEEADMIFDFKRKFVMYRIPDRTLCFLGPLDEDAPQPNELADELEREKNNPENVHAARPITKWNAQSLLEARYVVSDEMAKLCAQHPIYLLEKDETQVNVVEENGRVKRQWGSFGVGIKIDTPIVDIEIGGGLSFGKRRR